MNKEELINITQQAIIEQCFEEVALLDTLKDSLQEKIDKTVLAAAKRGEYHTSINLHSFNDLI